MNTQLAVTPRVGKTDLTLQRLTQLIIEHRAPIKPQAMLRLVRDFSLTETQADMLLEARAEYSASPARMRQLMEGGFTADQVHGLYEARERINSSLSVDGVTIAKLLKVREAFTGANCDADSLTEIVLGIYEAATKDRPEMSLGAALNMACYIAERSGAAMLDTVLDFVRTYGGRGGAIE